MAEPDAVTDKKANIQLSQLLARVREKEEIIVTKAGELIARLIPIVEQLAIRAPGSAKGKAIIAPDFDMSLPGPVLKSFEE